MASRAIRSRITVNYRGGELFLHVTLDGSQDLDEHGFADKSKIEEALDVVLKSNNLGCHFGGGTGLRYSYIDLAFLDVDAGIQAVRQRLQAGRTPKRSWIQFLTTTWRQNGSEFTTTVRRHP